MARLIVSQAAQDDVRAILAFLQLNAGLDVARKYVEGFDRATDLLVDFPAIGMPRPELGPHARTTRVDPYLLIYDHDQGHDTVTVLRVVHGRRNITVDMITRR
jgi:toxin ParE1/3/4